MTENDKAELLKWLNKAVENYQSDNLNKYFTLKSGWQKIVEKEDKGENDGKRNRSSY